MKDIIRCWAIARAAGPSDAWRGTSDHAAEVLEALWERVLKEQDSEAAPQMPMCSTSVLSFTREDLVSMLSPEWSEVKTAADFKSKREARRLSSIAGVFYHPKSFFRWTTMFAKRGHILDRFTQGTLTWEDLELPEAFRTWLQRFEIVTSGSIPYIGVLFNGYDERTIVVGLSKDPAVIRRLQASAEEDFRERRRSGTPFAFSPEERAAALRGVDHPRSRTVRWSGDISSWSACFGPMPKASPARMAFQNDLRLSGDGVLGELLWSLETIRRACREGRPQEGFEIYSSHLLRGEKFFLSKTLGAFDLKLAVETSFFADGWQPLAGLNGAAKAEVVRNLGYTLRGRGEFQDAIPLLEQALAGFKNRNDSDAAATTAGNLSGVHLALGDLQHAHAYAMEAVELADRGTNVLIQTRERLRLGRTLHVMNALEEAWRWFADADKCHRSFRPTDEFAGPWSPYWCCDLLLDRGEVATLAPREAWAFRIGQDSALDIAQAHLLRARLCARGGNDPFPDFEDAITGLRRAGRVGELPMGYLARARVLCERGDYPACQADITSAREPAFRCGMRLHQIDCHLAQARLYRAQGKHVKARGECAAAERLIAETRYHRRDDDLTELRRDVQ